MERKKPDLERFNCDSQEIFSLDKIEEFINHKLIKMKSKKLFFFKPNKLLKQLLMYRKSFRRFRECKYSYK